VADSVVGSSTAEHTMAEGVGATFENVDGFSGP
jgi:hypothetical protein